MGVWDVWTLLDNMPADLLEHWMAYSLIHPFGHNNRLLSQLAAMYYNTHRGEGPTLDYSDFLPVKMPDDDKRNLAMEKNLIEAMRKNKCR